MALSVRASFSLSIAASLLALGACSGGDDGGTVVIVDAAIDAPIDAPPDAPPPVCNAPSMLCEGNCVDVRTSEQFCGNCTTACTGGQVCTASQCACPEVTVPTSVTSGLATNLGGALIGTSALSGNALLVGADPVGTVVDQAYDLSTITLGALPTVAFAIDLDIQNQTASAGFAATEGTLTITTICPDDPNTQLPDGGLAGTVTNAKFSAVDGILTGAPVIVPGGCTLPATGTIPTITFSIGNTSCAQ